MPSQLDLKLRIIAEMSRDDLEDDLADLLATHISRAIEYYQGRRFWFTYGTVNANTSIGTATLSMPATMRLIDTVKTPAGDLLIKRPLNDILASSTSSGTPTHYAEFGDGIYLYPTPASVLALSLFGVKYMAAPTNDADSTSVWTNQGYDLITEHTKMSLYRDKFRDPTGTELAMGALSDALTRIENETTRRNDTPLRMPGHFPAGTYTAY